MANNAQLFAVDGVMVRRIECGGDLEAVQRLFERCGDYVRVVEGRPPGPDAGQEFLDSGPEKWSPDRVDKLGVLDAD